MIIKSSSQNDDSLWMRFKASDEAILSLSKIFGIGDSTYEDEVPKPLKSYDDWMLYRKYFTKDSDNVLAYFILSEKIIHIILRKKGNWEPIRDKILEQFNYATQK